MYERKFLESEEKYGFQFSGNDKVKAIKVLNKHKIEYSSNKGSPVVWVKLPKYKLKILYKLFDMKNIFNYEQL